MRVCSSLRLPRAQVWARQIILALGDVFLTRTYLLSSLSSRTASYVQAIANAFCLAAACLLNFKYQPFKEQVLPHLSQNTLEGLLLAVNSLQAVLACLYLAAKDSGGGTLLDVIQVTMVVVQVVFVACVIGLASGKMKKLTDVLAACFPSSIASEIAQAEEAMEEIDGDAVDPHDKEVAQPDGKQWNAQSYVEKQKRKLQREATKKEGGAPNGNVRV